jgi:hypothetical protein
MTNSKSESADLASAINRIFKMHFEPFGNENGKADTKYLSRWRAPNGVVVLAENPQPNIWLKQRDFARLLNKTWSTTPEHFEPGVEMIGFHSNVSETSGFAGQTVVKLRATSELECRAMAKSIVEEMRKK